MILDTESWMNIRRFRALHAAGATFAEIGRECGCDWRTVRKYLAEDAASVPPAGPSRMGTQRLLITPFIPLVEAWLQADPRIKGTVVHERLVAEYGFAGHYQRVKMFLAETRAAHEPRKESPTPDRPQDGAKSGQHTGAKSTCHSHAGGVPRLVAGLRRRGGRGRGRRRTR
jgi:hypothetical protein